ncbi:tetratricopeptide repeat-containing sensor histidine kinase, partial [Aegicerativicinus sediminis]
LIEKSQQEEYPLGEGYGFNALGELYRNLSYYQKSMEFHQKAEEIAEEIDNLELKVYSLNMIGVAYRRMDEVKPALDYHSKALELAHLSENPSRYLRFQIAVSQNSIGNIYLALEQYKLAITQFTQSLEIEEEMDNKLGLAINHENIGYAYEYQGFLERALEHYHTSLSYNEQINSNIGRIICYNSIGRVDIKKGNYKEAESYIEDALKLAIKANDKFYTSLSYINYGWVNLELDDFTDAEENLLKGLSMAETYNLKSYVVSASQHLSDLYSRLGDYQNALLYYQKATETDKTINNERNLKYVNDVIVQFENEAKNREIQALASENEAVRQKLKTNNIIFWFTIFAIVIIAAILIIILRNRQLNQEKQILTLEQEMLRSQMNPHFIFNSLNSIKLYIINNEKENAVYYLNKFSKLIRKILIATTEKSIPLKDELETMQLYMNIENIRFSNHIDFKIDIDPNVNTNNIQVPSLILQPFLENALWHGLSAKKEDKKIFLEIRQSDYDFVDITITDNGIGRKRSAEINQEKLLNRKSVGLSITKARLANFSKSFVHDYKLIIEDLHDENGKPIGTQVKLSIPLRPNVLKSA